MVDWFRIFRRASEPDYESLLSQLETRIKARESQLLAIRLRERRANALFITYGVGAWFVYLALWYLGVVGGERGLERALGGLPVIGGPIAIICTRRVLRYFYKRREDKEVKTLAELKKEQREKIEELKKKTGYYSTRNLLEKYDEAIKKNAEARGHASPIPNKSNMNSNLSSPSPNTPSKNGNQPSIPGTPINRPSTSSLNPNTPQSHQQQQQQHQHQQNSNQQPFPLLPPAASTPVPRTYIDKLADALLGVIPSDDAGRSGGANKYALICAKCFGHNGLVVKEEFDFIQYQCPRCGHFNPRRNSPPLRIRTTSMNPSTAPQTPDSSNHRRAKSLHVSSNLRDGQNSLSIDSPQQDDDEEDDDEEQLEEEESKILIEEPKVILLDKKKVAGTESEEGKPRRRTKKTDKKDENAMDTD